MPAIDWITTFDPTPMSFTISPREQVIGNEPNPYHGAKEIMHRWHQWHVVMEWNHLTNADSLRLTAHFARSRGGLATLKIPIFSYRAPRGNKTGSVTLSGNHAVGDVSLTITGGAGLLLQGDWIYISQTTDVPRAYLVVSSETAGVIQVIPGLRGAASSGSLVHHFDNGPIYDMMELVADPTFAAAMPSPLPGYFQPFSVELLSALRRTP